MKYDPTGADQPMEPRSPAASKADIAALKVHYSLMFAAERQMADYDHQNIFAKILRGEIPCFKVYETGRTLAFLDIMPRSPGHTLVIPKAPARGILDIDLAEVARSAKRV